MRKITRREVREFLLQALYARSVYGPDFSLAAFQDSYYEAHTLPVLEDVYFIDAFAGIVREEPTLLAVIAKLAPKFDPKIMPPVNLFPLCIGAYEMLYLKSDSIPEKVSINEAVELAKRFSDDGARELINGVLNKLKDEKSTILDTIVPTERVLFI